MSDSHADRLAARRRALVLDAAAQRHRLRREFGAAVDSASPLALARRAWAQLRERPALAVLPVAALLVLRRTAGREWASRAISLWRLWRRVRAIVVPATT